MLQMPWCVEPIVQDIPTKMLLAIQRKPNAMSPTNNSISAMKLAQQTMKTAKLTANHMSRVSIGPS